MDLPGVLGTCPKFKVEVVRGMKFRFYVVIKVPVGRILSISTRLN